MVIVATIAKVFAIGLLIAGLFVGSAYAADASAGERDPLFRDDTVLRAVLTAPIAQALRAPARCSRGVGRPQWPACANAGSDERNR